MLEYNLIFLNDVLIYDGQAHKICSESLWFRMVINNGICCILNKSDVNPGRKFPRSIKIYLFCILVAANPFD